MTETPRKDLPGRLLRLLSLLQSRREWSGAELAERLGVTDRTLRRDVSRLRALDYPVEGVTGTAGGYRLVSGRNLPPLLLDDDEAIAVALGLVTAADGSVAGIEDSSARALAKLEQVLPARLRPRLAALSDAAVAVRHGDVPRVAPDVLAVIAACRRDRRLLSFDYRNRADEAGARRVEPHHLVTLRGRWYLIAWDTGRADWRTFRADRIERPTPAHARFEPRELPVPDPAAYLTRVLAGASYRYTARMTVRLPAGAVRAGLFAAIRGEIEDRGTEGCAIRLSADSADLVVQYIAAIAALGAAFTLDAPPEIADRVRELGRRLTGPPTSFS
ncbi:helix-turn-helix transcriptional regulator [Actinoallomurus rhizosphaericola]|uniref:helix-turn-helix transcriptional regulator n=1 Tax=Actinoallomurus rhizosphaericola TaxID=2952536 RepID=UPI002093C54B|nr:WYL domain-containing protein [Actinoallomurus rhizosphaericola]MCO5996054.1 WYL domain-containing protein [Actinoallomurus rhizosphaericola]